ncbi:YVTN family beta-propeller protein [Leucobacter exalbidus]|uniref:YVTN family beta-propeller protein n=1 Tax=Leucobacter exalbidus TaxID=662960 RepID=A0A940T5E4_9MICO|nr:YncE family protein [Leucobacter exalbidus]MBP1325906.1 YVTN family beta-propeller protein [Leucobacter exalbidus]
MSALPPASSSTHSRRRHRAGLGGALLLVAALVLTGCSAAADSSSSHNAAQPQDSTEDQVTTDAPATDGSGSTDVAQGGAETLLVADFGADTVTFVDPQTGPTDSVQVGMAPYGLVVGADGRAWVATAEGVAVVDTLTRERLSLIPYEAEVGEIMGGEYRGGGMGIAMSPDGEQVYVGVNIPNRNGALEIIDVASEQVTDSVEVGLRPFDVDVAADGTQVYVTNHDSYDVTVIDAATHNARNFEVAPYGTEGGLGSWLKPHYAAVRADGMLALPFEGQKLAMLDPKTGSVTVEAMTASTHQHGTTYAPDGSLLVVGTGPIGNANGAASLTIRSPEGDERVIALDGPHEDVAVSSDSRTAYVSGGFTRDGYWDGITVVDLTSGDTRKLEAGQRPLGVAVLEAR